VFLENVIHHANRKSVIALTCLGCTLYIFGS
jgi:hypothetical protein